MPQSPHSIHWEREGSLTAKSLSPLAKTKNGLTVHSWIPPSSKFMGKILLFKIYGQNFAFQNLWAKFCFSKSSFFGKITANHADFTHFAHSPHELCKICYKIHPH